MLVPVRSTEVTADAIVSAVPGALCAVLLTGGSDAATIILYDNASAASGTILATLKAAANVTVSFCPANPLAVSKGIYADITGTVMSAYVSFF